MTDSAIAKLNKELRAKEKAGKALDDTEKAFLGEARIASAMVSMLAAIPKTPLYARLAAEGRLDESEAPASCTNVIPRGMTPDELATGYRLLMRDLYEPEAYFRRVNEFVLETGFAVAPARSRYWRTHPWQGIRGKVLDVARAHEMRVVGPNGLGTLSTRGRLCLPFVGVRPLRPGAVDISRQIKSSIPRTGAYGIEIRDELEFEKEMPNKRMHRTPR